MPLEAPVTSARGLGSVMRPAYPPAARLPGGRQRSRRPDAPGTVGGRRRPAMTDPLMTDPLTLLLDALDGARRRSGRLMDAAGLGPRTTPSLRHAVAPGVNLHTYPSARPDGPPVVLVPAPIKRSYLWDLEPDVSV